MANRGRAGARCATLLTDSLPLTLLKTDHSDLQSQTNSSVKFHICIIEPQGYSFGHFLDNFCRLVCFTLESLGHSCSIGSNELEPDLLNIVLGGHLLGMPEDVDVLAGTCRYIAVQHEILNVDGVNLTRDSRRFHDVYLPFLHRALIVWDGIPRNLAPLRKLGIRSAHFRGGYHPGLEDVRPKRERDIDFLFYGSMTPHRQQMLERLRQHGHQVVAVFDPRAIYRNDLIARAKVNLAPIQGPGMEHFASGRVCYLLNNRALVVVERCEDQEWLEHCFVSASTDHWIDVCEQTLWRNDRDEICHEFAERFRQLPFTDQMQRLLDETFGQRGDVPTDAANVSSKCVASSAPG